MVDRRSSHPSLVGHGAVSGVFITIGYRLPEVSSVGCNLCECIEERRGEHLCEIVDGVLSESELGPVTSHHVLCRGEQHLKAEVFGSHESAKNSVDAIDKNDGKLHRAITRRELDIVSISNTDGERAGQVRQAEHVHAFHTGLRVGTHTVGKQRLQHSVSHRSAEHILPAILTSGNEPTGVVDESERPSHSCGRVHRRLDKREECLQHRRKCTPASHVHRLEYIVTGALRRNTCTPHGDEHIERGHIIEVAVPLVDNTKSSVSVSSELVEGSAKFRIGIFPQRALHSAFIGLLGHDISHGTITRVHTGSILLVQSHGLVFFPESSGIAVGGGSASDSITKHGGCIRNVAEIGPQ